MVATQLNQKPNVWRPFIKGFMRIEMNIVHDSENRKPTRGTYVLEFYYTIYLNIIHNTRYNTFYTFSMN